MVLVTEDVGEDRLLISLAHHTHGNAGDGTDHRHTGILQRQRTGADRSHGGGSVALQDVAHHADGVGIVLGDHAVEGTHGEIAVTDLTTADALGARGLTGAEGREIIVEEEALLALEEGVIDQLLIVLGTEGDRGECLGLSAGEDGRSVRCGEAVHLRPYRTHILETATVEALVMVEHGGTYRQLDVLIVVAIDQRLDLLELFLAVLSLKLLTHLSEATRAGVLVVIR